MWSPGEQRCQVFYVSRHSLSGEKLTHRLFLLDAHIKLSYAGSHHLVTCVNIVSSPGFLAKSFHTVFHLSTFHWRCRGIETVAICIPSMCFTALYNSSSAQNLVEDSSIPPLRALQKLEQEPLCFGVVFTLFNEACLGGQSLGTLHQHLGQREMLAWGTNLHSE